jgi:hypothetical protein
LDYLRLTAFLLGKGTAAEKAVYCYERTQVGELMSREGFVMFLDKLWILVGDILPLLIRASGLM